MNKPLERRYHKKVSTDISGTIATLIIIFSYQTIKSFLLDNTALEKWQIDVGIFFIYFLSLYFLIDFLIKKFIIPRFKKTELIITEKAIKTGSQTQILWHKNLQVLQISDFKNSVLAKNNNALKDEDTAFLIIDKLNKFKKVQMIISTFNWQIEDSKDLQQFFAEIGYPVQMISAEESDNYFPNLVQADLGSKAGICAFLSIFWALISIAILQYDDYRTLDFGLWRYIAFAVFLLITIAIFKWISKEKKNSRFFQLIVTGLFSITFTGLLFAILLTSSAWLSTEKMEDFHYYGYDNKEKGVLWQQVNPPNFTVNCGDKRKKDKNNTKKTIRQANVIYTLGMVRVKQKEICLK